MKTVSGTIVSTKPVSLSKAANILSEFVTSDNGASQTVSAYLRRASAAFDELAYFKKHHKLKKNRSKDDVSAKSDISHRSLEADVGSVVENGGVSREINHDAVEVSEHVSDKVEGKLKKKEKKKKKSDGSENKLTVETEGGDVTVTEKSDEKKKKKKRKNAEVDGGENGNLATTEKKKRRKTGA